MLPPRLAWWLFGVGLSHTIDFLAIGVFVGIISTFVGVAAGAARPPEGVMLDLRSISNLTVNGQVLHGEPALPGQWPATFIFLINGKTCSSTAVGRRVILTAAHCVINGVDFAAELSFGKVGMTCNQNSDYAAGTDLSADFALCLLDVSLPDLDQGFERISADTHLTKPRGRLLLTGYGCTTDLGVPDFGHLYVAFATVADPSLDPSRGPNHILLSGGGAVCFGDSGGGTYWERSEGDVAGHRLLVGVNAKGNNTISWVSKTAGSTFLDWACDWAQGRTVSICGVFGQEDHCRTS